MKEARTPSRLLLLLSSGILALLFAENLLHAQAPGKIPPPTKIPALPLPPMTPTPQLPPAPSDFLYTADTNEVAKKQGLVKLGNFSWACQGLRCTAKSTAPAPVVAGCKALAEQIGQIKAYGHPAKQLNVEELKQCNAGIAVASSTPLANPIVPPVGQSQKPQQSSGQQQGGSQAQAPKAAASDGKTAASGTHVTAERLTYTGLGSTKSPPSFAPLRLRSDALTYTGVGTTGGPPVYAPVRIRADTIIYTGLGAR